MGSCKDVLQTSSVRTRTISAQGVLMTVEKIDVVLRALDGARYRVSIRQGEWQDISAEQVARLLIQFREAVARAYRLRGGKVFVATPNLRITRARASDRTR